MQSARAQTHDLVRIWGRVSDVSPGNVGITGVSAHAGLGNEVEIQTQSGVAVRGEILNIATNGPPILAQLEISGGRTSDIQIFQVEEFEGIRVIFDWYPTDASTDPIDMRMVLEGDGAPLSETWLYQYFPPPPEQREHPPHPLDD